MRKEDGEQRCEGRPQTLSRTHCYWFNRENGNAWIMMSWLIIIQRSPRICHRGSVGEGGGTNLEEGAWEGKVKEEGEARFRENECFSFRLYITVQDYWLLKRGRERKREREKREGQRERHVGRNKYRKRGRRKRHEEYRKGLMPKTR